MKKLLPLCLLLALVSGCVPLNYNATAKMYRDKSDIRDGVLIAGQPMKRFRQVWGNPTTTFSRRFNAGARGGIVFVRGIGGGSFETHGRETYDVWFYKEKETTVIFSRGELVYWMHGSEPPTEADFVPHSID